MTEAEKRALVIKELYEWIGTPWHHMSRVKGPNGGVDCAQLPYCVYVNAKQIDPNVYPVVEYYPPDWFMHKDEDRLLEIVKRFAHQVEVPQPADLALWKFGRTHSHVGIIVEGQKMIHADVEAKQVIEAKVTDGRLGEKSPIYFSRW